MKISICIFFALLSLFSCKKERQIDSSSNKVSHILFDIKSNQNLKLSSFVDTIEFIPLETNERNLIGEVNRIIYKKGKYYIRCTQGMRNPQIHVFNSDGTFSFSIDKKGGGPGEYIGFNDFALKNNGNICIFSYKKFIEYDSTGNFLYEHEIESPVQEGLYGKDDSFLTYNSQSVVNRNLLLKIIDNKGSVKKSFFERSEREAKICDYRVEWRSLVSNDSLSYFIYPYCDTIFEINKESILPVYYIDYGNKKIPSQIFDSTDDGQTQEKKLDKIDDYMLTSAIGVGDNYLYVGSIDKSYKAYLTLYSKKNKTVLTGHKVLDDMFLKGNLIPLTAKNMPHNIETGDILWELEPKYLIKGYNNYMSNLSISQKNEFGQKYPQLMKICATLKEDDNPVLLRIRVKDF